MSNSPRLPRGSRGFSLLPLAVLLVVLGLAVVLVVALLPERAERERIDQTEQTLDQAEEALVGFVIRNARLPCPDVDADGLEDCAPGNVVGTLPHRTMGLPATVRDAAFVPVRYAPYRNANTAADADADLATLPNRYVPDVPSEFESFFDNQDLVDTCSTYNTAENQSSFQDMVSGAGDYASSADQDAINELCSDPDAQQEYVSGSCDDIPELDVAELKSQCEDSAQAFNDAVDGMDADERQQYCDDNNIDPCEPCNPDAIDASAQDAIEQMKASCEAQNTPEKQAERLAQLQELCNSITDDLGAGTLNSADPFAFCGNISGLSLSEPPAQYNLFDFCVGLENASAADGSTALVHTLSGGVATNVAYVLASGGLEDANGNSADGSFDGNNEGADVSFDSPELGRIAGYDDRVRAKTFAALQREVSCVPVMGAMRALAALASDAVGDVGDAESDLALTYINMVIAIVQLANSIWSLAHAIAMAVAFAGHASAATACAATVVLAANCGPAAAALGVAATAFALEAVGEGIAVAGAAIELGVAIANVVQAEQNLDTITANANDLLDAVFAADLRGGLR